MHVIYAFNYLGRSRLKSDKKMRKVSTESHLFTPDLEYDQTHVTLRDNPNHNVTPLSSCTTTLKAAAVDPNK
jgi:hypothetical protein